MATRTGLGRLEGKVAIITGGGQGVGLGLALAMAKEGAKLVLTGRTRSKLEAAARTIADLGSEARCVEGLSGERPHADRAVEEAISAFGTLNVLVNNAHSFRPLADLEATTDEDFATHWQSAFMGSVHFMQAALPHMQEKGGSIINVGSSSGFHCLPTQSAYASTKEAIRALTRVAAKEWGKYQIRVNMLNPSALSPYAIEYMKETGTYDLEVERAALGYIGDSEIDVAPVGVFLASDDSHFMTGQVLMADGGRVMV